MSSDNTDRVMRDLDDTLGRYFATMSEKIGRHVEIIVPQLRDWLFYSENPEPRICCWLWGHISQFEADYNFRNDAGIWLNLTTSWEFEFVTQCAPHHVLSRVKVLGDPIDPDPDNDLSGYVELRDRVAEFSKIPKEYVLDKCMLDHLGISYVGNR